MKLYMIRHGQTEWNSSYRLQGRTDTQLNDEGRRLAVETGRGLGKIVFDEVYTSPLARARETVELVLRGQREGAVGSTVPITGERVGAVGSTAPIIGERVGAVGNMASITGERDLAVYNKIPIFEDLRLQEISFGVMEGVKVRDDNGVLVVENFIRFFNDPEQYLPPREGESFEALLARTGEFLQDLKQKAKSDEPSDSRPRSGDSGKTDDRKSDRKILISTHGAASRALLANITHSPLRDFWRGGVPKNCAVSIADFENGEWRLVEQDVIFAQSGS